MGRLLAGAQSGSFSSTKRVREPADFGCVGTILGDEMVLSRGWSDVDGVGSRWRLLAGARSMSDSSSSRGRFRDRLGPGHLLSRAMIRRMDEGEVMGRKK